MYLILFLLYLFIDMQPQSTQQLGINDQLIVAAGKHDLPLIKKLLSQGADVNYIKISGQNGWYTGNTDSALYVALHKDFKDQKNYIDVLQTLLKAGASPKFQAVRGNWNHSTAYPLFNNISYKLGKFKIKTEIIRFIEVFVKYGINLNEIENHQRQKSCRGYSHRTCFIFQLMDQLHIRSKLDKIEKSMIEVHVDKIRIENDEKLRRQFQKQFPQYKLQNEKNQEQQEENEEDEEKQSQENQISQQIIDIIKKLIDLGVSPNSYKSDSSWENFKSAHYEGDHQYEEFSKFDTGINQRHETILHRAISNDLPDLVKYLLQKGADNTIKCKFTMSRAIHPVDWPENIKKRQIKLVNEQLKNAQEQKQDLIDELKNAEDEENKADIKEQIMDCDFRIYKSKRFCLQNECPKLEFEVKEVTCAELCKLAKVSQETLSICRQL